MTVAKRNRVTLADVAKAANVSRSTASRALNHRTHQENRG